MLSSIELVCMAGEASQFLEWDVASWPRLHDFPCQQGHNSAQV